MLQFSAALLSRAFGPLIALFSSPRGRHSCVAGRRRSTRVRRYVHAAPPAAPAAPRLTPPSDAFEAEHIALVRPYYAAHETLRASTLRIPAPRAPLTEPDEVRQAFIRVQERAAALLQRWREDPNGALSGEPAPRFGVVRLIGPTVPARAWIEQRQGVPA